MANEAWKREVEQMMAQVKLKHQPAFDRLYDLTSAKLFGLVVKVVADEQLSADILQEVYCKIWSQADRYRADLGSAWSWICQVTRNLAIDHIRHRKRLNEADESHIEDYDGEDIFQQSPESVDLGRCLNEIRTQQRSLIISAYVQGWSHAELAQSTDVPLGTLKSWIRRGLKELRECLEA